MNHPMSLLFFGLALPVCTHAQDLYESFESGMPAYQSTNHAPPGATLNLASGAWFAINHSPVIGSTGVSGSSVDFLPLLGNEFAAMDFQAAPPGSAGAIDLWLMSPVRTFKNGDVISFYTISPVENEYAERLRLRLSAAGTSTNRSDFQTLLTISPFLQAGAYPESWAQYAVTVSGLSAPITGRFALHYDLPDNVVYSNSLGFDEVRHLSNICRVANNGTPTANGASWTTPLTLAAALANPDCTQIWLRRGVYRPNIANQRYDVTRPVQLYGGFLGTESSIEQRSFLPVDRSILSGDLENNDLNSDNNSIAESYTQRVGTNAATVMQVQCLDAQMKVLLDAVHMTAGTMHGLLVNGSCEAQTTLSLIAGNGTPAMTAGGVHGPDAKIVLHQAMLRGNAGDLGAGVLASDVRAMQSLWQDNRARLGGGIYATTATLDNTTFSANSATTRGGALYTLANARVNQSSFVANSATDGGAVFVAGALQLRNNVFAENTASNATASVFTTGSVLTIQGNVMPSASCLAMAPTGSLECSGTLNGDPLLRPLDNNGGAWPAYVLRSGSAAIDVGVGAACTTLDQRGVSRPQGASCDAGAIERRLQAINLTVKASIGGAVNVTPAPTTGTGIVNCLSSTSPCMTSYADESNRSTLTFVATPQPGYEFTSWALDCAGLSSTTTVILDRNKTCRAVFAPAEILLRDSFE